MRTPFRNDRPTISDPSEQTGALFHAEARGIVHDDPAHPQRLSNRTRGTRRTRRVRSDPEPINLFEYEALAREQLAPMAYDYYASGAHDEVTLRENRAAFDHIRLRYRVLVDVSRRDLSTTVLGEPLSMPVLVGPTAFHRMAHPDGEVATARAARRAGTLMVLSTLSNSSVEEVTAAAPGPLWFQLYVYRDRGATRALVERVEAAGCRALVLTVDAPLLGRREMDVRNRFHLPPGLRIENLAGMGFGELPTEVADSGLAAYFAALLDPSLTWADVDWLCAATRLPVVIKGVVRGDDASRAIDHGVAAVIVSNHGGRQLDTSPPTIEALPEVVDAVGGQMEVLMDGGIRRGTDVVKAIGLGAKAVLLGRPALWGLAVAGEQGVSRVLELLRQEIDLAMALCGCTSPGAIQRDLIDRR
ncbi:MAG: alpha-hydroxy-acid oxidizing protein [Chloroflexi bacterium]|nr:alpha-hydroxy-acid oxidizing protein [Chloroflexota bacterium]